MPSAWRDGGSVFQSMAWLESSLSARKPRRFLGLRFREGDIDRGWAAFESPASGWWRPAGSGGADFLDVVAEPGYEEAVANAFARWFEGRRDWLWIDLPQARPGSVVERVPGVVASEGETCPFLVLPEDWETFRRGLGKSLRGNIGYYGRALAKLGEVEVRTATAQTLETDLDAFFTLHQQRWRARWMPGAFADSGARAFHRDLAGRLVEQDRLRLHTLRLGGRPIAAIHCMVGGDETAYYLGGFDPEFARWSPGTVLTAHAIRTAIERDGSRRFEFLRGDERYKYAWGAKDRRNRRFGLARGLAGEMLRRFGARQLAAEMALKGRMHSLHGGAGARPVDASRKEQDGSTGKEPVNGGAVGASGTSPAATAGKGTRR